ncbi:MAG TPA: helix-turn-helix transcriptional regulator [Thermoanaerobaculia bacterium]
MVNFIHEELRRAREKAGLSQQALADLAGIQRNQVVRAERGDNITLDTLRKLAAHLPVTELTLLDTTGLRVDIIADPEKLFFAAMENVLRLTDALSAAVELAMEARSAVEVARRIAPPLPLPEGHEPAAAELDPGLLLRHLGRIAEEIRNLGGDAPPER